MYGQRQQDSEFFAPKQQEPTASSGPGWSAELGELNTSFLDSLHAYGEVLCNLVKRLLQGLAQLRQAVRDGKMSPAFARRAAALAIAAAALCTAAVARGALQRRQRRIAWEAALAGGYFPGSFIMPRASL